MRPLGQKVLFSNTYFRVYPDCLVFNEEYTFPLDELLELVQFLMVNGGPSEEDSAEGGSS